MDAKKATQDSPSAEGGNGFDELLRKHRKGAAAALASRYLSEMLERLEETEGTASLTVKLTLKKGSENEVQAEFQVSPPKLPTEALPAAVYWMGEENPPRLHRSDPRQAELPLKEFQSGEDGKPLKEAQNQ